MYTMKSSSTSPCTLRGAIYACRKSYEMLRLSSERAERSSMSDAFMPCNSRVNVSMGSLSVSRSTFVVRAGERGILYWKGFMRGITFLYFPDGELHHALILRFVGVQLIRRKRARLYSHHFSVHPGENRTHDNFLCARRRPLEKVSQLGRVVVRFALQVQLVVPNFGTNKPLVFERRAAVPLQVGGAYDGRGVGVVCDDAVSETNLPNVSQEY